MRVLAIGGLGVVAAGVAGYTLYDVVQCVDPWLNPWLDPRSFQIVSLCWQLPTANL
jgi:hypothetical protein